MYEYEPTYLGFRKAVNCNFFFNHSDVVQRTEVKKNINKLKKYDA
jgi:hypothetical protein